MSEASLDDDFSEFISMLFKARLGVETAVVVLSFFDKNGIAGYNLGFLNGFSTLHYNVFKELLAPEILLYSCSVSVWMAISWSRVVL